MYPFSLLLVHHSLLCFLRVLQRSIPLCSTCACARLPALRDRNREDLLRNQEIRSVHSMSVRSSTGFSITDTTFSYIVCMVKTLNVSFQNVVQFHLSPHSFTCLRSHLSPVSPVSAMIMSFECYTDIKSIYPQNLLRLLEIWQLWHLIVSPSHFYLF